jgi:hypothetical protein
LSVPSTLLVANSGAAGAGLGAAAGGLAGAGCAGVCDSDWPAMLVAATAAKIPASVMHLMRPSLRDRRSILSTGRPRCAFAARQPVRI